MTWYSPCGIHEYRTEREVCGCCEAVVNSIVDSDPRLVPNYNTINSCLSWIDPLKYHSVNRPGHPKLRPVPSAQPKPEQEEAMDQHTTHVFPQDKSTSGTPNPTAGGTGWGAT